MNIETLSRLNYILGRLEGISCVATGSVQEGIFGTCEMLGELIKHIEDGSRAWDAILQNINRRVEE